MSLLSDLIDDAKRHRKHAHKLMKQGRIKWAKEELRSGMHCIALAKELLKRANK